MQRHPVFIAPFQFDEKVKHLISTRTGGYSLPPYASLNLGMHVGDRAEHVQKNRQIVAQHLDIPPAHLCFMQQVHGHTVAVIDKAGAPPPIADAMITNRQGIALCVLTADCVPLLLYAPQAAAIGVVHAGWRGLAAGIIPESIRQMKKAYGVLPKQLVVGIGPHISVQYYEVGEEVATALQDAVPVAFRSQVCIRKKESGRYHADLPAVAKAQLMAEGIPPENIQSYAVCTYEAKEQFYSARREGTKSGRFASVIMLEPHR